MTQIIPSIFVTSEEKFKEQIDTAKDIVKMVQIDVADGNFVPHTTWPFHEPKKAQDYIDFDFELHLMVEHPLQVVKNWAQNNRLKRVLVHYESTMHLDSLIYELSILDKEIGIVLNPDTSLYAIEPYMENIKIIMLMGVYPGAQGQSFIPETLDRIRTIKEKNKNIIIEIDGGVNEDTLPGIINAGADIVCPGSAIFGNKEKPSKNIEKLTTIINSLTTKN